METSSSAQSRSSPRVHVKTLGGLAVLDTAGQPIHAATALRRPVAVLVAVAATGERGIARDKLIGLLWPEFHPDRARHSLTQAIYNARKVTGVDDLFLTDGVLRVNAARVSSDITEVELALQRAELERAVALYDGPFLDGFFVPESPDFEQWVSLQRARVEQRVASALEELIARAGRNGEDRQAIEWARRLVAVRPLDSSAVTSLVVRLASAGDRAGAVRSALDHVAALRTQLELAPDQSFLRLLDSLREPSRPAVGIDLQSANPVVFAQAPGQDNHDLALETPSPALVSTTAVAIPIVRQSRLKKRIPIAVAGLACSLTILVGLRVIVPRINAPAPRSDGQAQLLVSSFDVSGADSSLGYMGRGLAQLLATSLDGAGTPRVINAPAATRGESDSQNDSADLLRDGLVRSAAQRGAKRLVLGTIVGGRKRTVASVTELELPSGSVLARASVAGPADSLARIARLLAAKLLVAEAGEDSSLALRWETSLPALNAFLMGRRAVRRFAYASARRSFQEALQLDSAFAPAALQLARIADRLGDAAELDAALARAWPRRESLTELERSELIALAGPNYPRATPRSVQLASWANLVRGAPRRAASWYALGLRFAHDGARISAENADEQARFALNRALVIDPAYAPARDLLGHLAMRAARTSAPDTARSRVDTSSVLAPFLQWRAAIAAGDSDILRGLRQQWRAASSENIRAIAMASQFDAIGLADGALAIRILGTRASSMSQRLDLVLAAHSLELNLGHAADALGQTARLRELRPDSHAYLRLRILDALYGAGDTVAGRNAANELAVPIDSLLRESSLARNRVASDGCVLEQWRLAHGDTAGVDAVLTLLHAPDAPRDRQPVSASPSVCADLVEAARAVLTRDRRALTLVDRLDQLVLSSAVAGNASEYSHIVLSRLYGALGHPRRALGALRKRTYMSGWPTYLATTWNDELRLARTVGDERRAALSRQRLAILHAASAAVEPMPLPAVGYARAGTKNARAIITAL